MTTKQKRAQQKRAATYVARIILNSLYQFPKGEREQRLKDVHRALKTGPNKRGKRATRSSTLASPRVSRLSAKPR